MLDKANSFLTDIITDALDKAAPLTRIQTRRKYRSWLSDRTKEIMSDRDAARDLARQSKLDSDWIQYKKFEEQVY